MFIRVWEYEVSAVHIDGFIAAYGADGDWAQLFQRGGQGYLGTELYRSLDASTDDKTHFVTVDRWLDEATWRAFLRDWGTDYELLDATMKGLPTFQRGLSEGSL